MTDRPKNLRSDTLGSSTQGSTTQDFKRMSFSMNSRNVHGQQARPDLICALCQGILIEPWECKECHNRFH